jgi:(1->4)-alpha-D-glucan 1-alpha-D-glucosylmutase
VLDPARNKDFLNDVAAFVAQIAPAGAANGLVQTALRCLLPGVPDLYQGSEFWDFSLVDPDNRRPVAFDVRQHALAERHRIQALVDCWPDGRIKLALIARLLRLRALLPDVFANGDYQALAVTGARSAHALAFLRRGGGQLVLVVAGRLMLPGLQDSSGLAPDPVWWGDAEVTVPPDLPLMHAVIGEPLSTDQRISALLSKLPVGVWASKSL